MSESDRQSEIKRILDEAADLSSAERDRYLDEACADDASLRSEVESLLKHLESPSEISDQTQPMSGLPGLGDVIPSPTQIGPYEVIDKIGEGGMGVVYKATQSLPRRTVALKVIKPQMVTRHSLERFHFETQVLGRLQHPGIAQIYDAGTTRTDFGEQPYFAMEYIRGTPLSEYVKLRHCTLQERLALVQKIADAVHHAHTRGVVHRDIKPANILVTEDGQPKILDFGVARSIGADIDDSANMTRVGQLVGTVPYMSPEQVGGESDEIDARSDIYSLGVVLYELLAGHLPYNLEKQLVHEAVRVIREVEPEHLSSVSRVYKGDIETIVSKALSKERTRRYQSASEFSADIHRYLTNQPVLARPASAWYQVSKLAKRHKMTAVGITIASAGIVLGLGVAIWQLDRALSAEADLQDKNTQLAIALGNEEKQRKRAEDVLEKLRSFTAMLGDFEEAIRRLEGATSARRVLAENSLAVLKELAETGETYSWIREDIADASLSMGEIALVGAETLPIAESSFQMGSDLFGALLAEQPDKLKYQLGGIRAKLGLSAVLLRQGSTQAAAALSSEAEQECALIIQENPGEQSPLEVRFHVLIQRGAVLRYQARFADALASYQAAKELARSFSESDLEIQDAIVRAARGEAVVLNDLGRTDEADEVFTEALEASRSFVVSYPRDAVGKQRLIELLYYVAERQEQEGEDAEALLLHQERLSLATDLAQADPDNETAQVAVVTSHDAISHAQLELEETELAERSAQSFLAAARRMADEDPTDLIKHRRVALAEELLGDVSREPNVQTARDLANDDSPDPARIQEITDQLNIALTKYESAFSTIEWLESMDTDSVEFARDAVRLQVKLARTYELLGRLEAEGNPADEAEKAYLVSVSRYQKLDQLNALTNSERDLWARTLRNLGTGALNRGEGALAAKRLEEADTIYPRERADIIARKAAAYNLAGDDQKARALAAQVLEMLEANPDTRRADWLSEQMNMILNLEPLP
ncbi:MAG: serine/threonine protein kinase [Phycisphaera sp.]|nr:MAG: serine/threonine protein kinase [Phycisphaera sp.]